MLKHAVTLMSEHYPAVSVLMQLNIQTCAAADCDTRNIGHRVIKQSVRSLQEYGLDSMMQERRKLKFIQYADVIPLLICSYYHRHGVHLD